MTTDPLTELEPRFSSPGATPIPWAEARAQLEQAQMYWLTTVRPDGRPHVTPLIAAWQEDVMYFSTGPAERKAKNLERNRHCIITTGCNTLAGIDLVIEGDAVSVSDESRLRPLAEAFAAKYGTDIWNFTVRDGAFYQHGRVLVFALAPTTVFGFGKGATFSQTRWRFSPEQPGNAA